MMMAAISRWQEAEAEAEEDRLFSKAGCRSRCCRLTGARPRKPVSPRSRLRRPAPAYRQSALTVLLWCSSSFSDPLQCCWKPLLLILFRLDRAEKNNKKWTKTWTSMRQKLVVHLLLQSVIRDWILQMLQWQCVPFLASCLRNWDCGERWRGSRGR